MKAITAFLVCCFLLMPTPAFTEEIRERITVNREQDGTLINIRVYRNNLLFLSYGYFTAENRNSNGTPSSTVLILEETGDVFMHFDENGALISFSHINYNRGEEFEICFCAESEDSRQRCDAMQTMWNELYVRYGIERRVRQALGHR